MVGQSRYPVDHAKGADVGLIDEIFEFVRLYAVLDGHQNRAKSLPSRKDRQPSRYIVARAPRDPFRDADGEKSFRKPVDPSSKALKR